MSVSGTNAPVSVHISYQCSIGPDSPIYDVAHTPAPKPMARKVTTRRPMDLLPPLPPDDGTNLRDYNAGPIPAPPAPSPMAPNFPRAFPFDATVNAPGESPRGPVARSLTAPVEGVDEIRRRWATDAAVEAARRRKQVSSTSDSEEDDCSHRRTQSARKSICLEDLAGPLSRCLADPYEGVDSTARMRRRRNLARKGGSAHGMGKRSIGLSPVPRARSLLSVLGKAQPDAAHCSTDNASPASGDEDDPYMNLAQARGGSRSDLSGGLGPNASPADVSSADMGFSVCDDSGYGDESVEDARGNFQTATELPIPAWELPLSAPADDAEVPDWDSPMPVPEPYKERPGLLARTDTVDSGCGVDAEPSRPTTPLPSDATAAPSHAVQLSLRSKNAGRSMVRRLGSLMGELAGELQSVRRHQSDVEA